MLFANIVVVQYCVTTKAAESDAEAHDAERPERLRNFDSRWSPAPIAHAPRRPIATSSIQGGLLAVRKRREEVTLGDWRSPSQCEA